MVKSGGLYKVLLAGWLARRLGKKKKKKEEEKEELRELLKKKKKKKKSFLRLVTLSLTTTAAINGYSRGGFFFFLFARVEFVGFLFSLFSFIVDSRCHLDWWVHFTSMLMILISSRGFSLLSVFAVSILCTTSIPEMQRPKMECFLSNQG